MGSFKTKSSSGFVNLSFCFLVQLLKPIPQRERSQWEVGVGHAEDAFAMTRQERIDNYTFIYVDPDPNEATGSKKPNVRAEKRNRRSSGSVRKKEDGRVKSPDREQPPRRQLPRRQCSVSNTDDSTNSQASNEEKNQRGDGQRKASSPKQNTGCDARAQQDSPPPVRAWKTAAARKLLPLSITMKRLNVEITKCDWPLLQKKAALSPKKDKEEDKEERVEREARQPDLGYCSPEVGVTHKQKHVCMTELSSEDISNVDAFSRIAELNLSPVLRRRKTGMKERKRGRRGEAPPPVGGVKREERSRHPLLDHTTVVHKVGQTQTCRVFCFDEYLTCKVGKRCSSIFFCVFRFSGEEAAAAVSEEQV